MGGDSARWDQVWRRWRCRLVLALCSVAFALLAPGARAQEAARVVLVTGEKRDATATRIQAELDTTTPYRIASVDYRRFADDFTQGAGEAEVDRERLLGVLRRYLEGNDMSADWQSINRAGNEFLVNTLSVMSPYGPEEKQALLEAETLAARAEVLMTLAQMLLAGDPGNSGSAKH